MLLSLWIIVIAIVFLLFLSAFFSGSETALTAVSNLTTEAPIAQSTFSKIGNLLIMACNSNDCQLYFIDGNGDQFTAGSPVSPNYQRIALSPYFKQQYGREYLEDLRLNNGVLEPLNLQQVIWFEMDYFEGQLYYITQTDTGLQRLNLHTHQPTTWPGNQIQNVLATYFHIDNEAN